MVRMKVTCDDLRHFLHRASVRHLFRSDVRVTVHPYYEMRCETNYIQQ